MYERKKEMAKIKTKCYCETCQYGSLQADIQQLFKLHIYLHVVVVVIVAASIRLLPLAITTYCCATSIFSCRQSTTSSVHKERVFGRVVTNFLRNQNDILIKKLILMEKC